MFYEFIPLERQWVMYLCRGRYLLEEVYFRNYVRLSPTLNLSPKASNEQSRLLSVPKSLILNLNLDRPMLLISNLSP